MTSQPDIRSVRFFTSTRPQKTIPSVFLSFFGSVCIALLFSASSSQFSHWFIIPVTLCGIVIGTDAVDWLRGRLNLFDPVGVVGLFGLHLFFLAPLLHVAWDHQLLYLPALEEWRPWLGHMALLNFVGLLFYRLSRNVFRPRTTKHNVWLVNQKAISAVLLVAMGLTAALQILVYARFGGVAGYISTFEETVGGDNPGFTGLGTLFAIAESFPLLLMIAYALVARERPRWRSWGVIIAVLAIFFVTRIFFGGFRGSRSNTIFAMIWAVGVIHLIIRPAPRRFIFVGLILALIFMYVFGFYKNVGLDAFQILQDPGRAAELEQTTNRTFQVTLLSDLARTDIQAYVLQRLSRPSSDYQYPYGISYVGGLLTPIPDAIFPLQILTKVDLGTRALYGLQVYRSGSQRSSRNFGLAGEALLNFGPLAIPFSFIGLGFVVSVVRRWLLSWAPEDSRRLLLPLLILCCLVLIINDSDNVSVFLLKQGLVPFVVVWLGSRRAAKA